MKHIFHANSKVLPNSDHTTVSQPENSTRQGEYNRFGDETDDEVNATYEREKVIERATADAKWETLLTTEESQKLLEKMANEAWAQIQVGQAKPMIFAEDGTITPGQAQQI